ncbi:uncharacterized protein LOC143033462 [Oratosquilla oratoria]|uniref:uncharacterized protein LOC143033462 n=1 Tax=Oratosquilla oratoria TaxID=337810 RepID=UPI003F75D284
MESLQYVLFILMLSAFGSRAASIKDEGLNQYIDMVLDNIQTMMVNEGLDTVPLPEASLGFNHTVLGVTWFGKVGLIDGWLQGISTLERKDDAHFTFDADGKVNGIQCTMGVVTLKAYYKGVATFMNLGPKFDLDAVIHGVDVWFSAGLSRDVCKFTVSSLEIKKIGLITVDIHGLGFINYIMEIVTDFVINIITVFIRELIENNLHNLINQGLDTVDLAPASVILGCDREPLQNLPHKHTFIN